MKSLKLVLIAAIFATAFVNQAASEGFQSKPHNKIINLTFEQAIQSPALVLAMYQQLDGAVLQNNQSVYTLSVVFMNYTYRITGTYEQWSAFFGMHLVNLSAVNYDPISR